MGWGTGKLGIFDYVILGLIAVVGIPYVTVKEQIKKWVK